MQNFHWIHDTCGPAILVLTTACMLVNQSHLKLTDRFCAAMERAVAHYKEGHDGGNAENLTAV